MGLEFVHDFHGGRRNRLGELLQHSERIGKHRRVGCKTADLVTVSLSCGGKVRQGAGINFWFGLRAVLSDLARGNYKVVEARADGFRGCFDFAEKCRGGRRRAVYC
jgi:hypothetical protein